MQRRSDAKFVFQAEQGLRILAVEHFERDPSLQFKVISAVHRTHAARTDALPQSKARMLNRRRRVGLQLGGHQHLAPQARLPNRLGRRPSFFSAKFANCS